MYPNISENTWSIWQLQIWFTWPCRALSCSVVLCTFRITRNTCRSARTVKLGQIGGSIDIRLVVWNMNFISPYIGNFIIPTDELIFFRRVAQPPTRYWLMAWCRSRLGDGEDQTLRGEPREAADQSTTGTRWPIFDVECGVFHRDVGCFWTFVKHGESHGFWEPAGCWATTSWHQKAGGFQPGDGMREGFYRKIMKIGVFIVTFQDVWVPLFLRKHWRYWPHGEKSQFRNVDHFPSLRRVSNLRFSDPLCFAALQILNKVILG